MLKNILLVIFGLACVGALSKGDAAFVGWIVLGVLAYVLVSGSIRRLKSGRLLKNVAPFVIGLIVIVALSQNSWALPTLLVLGALFYITTRTNIVHRLMVGKRAATRQNLPEAIYSKSFASEKPYRYITTEVRRAVADRDGGRCVQCGSTQNLHYDHILPVSKGGANTIDNIQILCQTCNLRKGGRY